MIKTTFEKLLEGKEIRSINYLNILYAKYDVLKAKKKDDEEKKEKILSDIDYSSTPNSVSKYNIQGLEQAKEIIEREV